MIAASLRIAQKDVCLRKMLPMCSLQPQRCSLQGLVLLPGRPFLQGHINIVKVSHCSTCLQSKDSSSRRTLCGNSSHFGQFRGTGWPGVSQVRSVSETVLKQNGRNPAKNDQSNFAEKENEYFHSYLESSPEYQPYLLSSIKSGHTFAELSTESMEKEVMEAKAGKIDTLLLILQHWTAVAKKGKNVPADKMFYATVRLLGRHAPRMSKKQLLECMACLSRLGFRESDLYFSEPRRNRILLSKTFDKACCKNMREFEVKELFLAADFFYAMRGSAFTEFPYMMCEKLKNLLLTLSKSELVLLLFHTGLSRRSPTGLVDEVLDQLEPFMTSLSLQELGIVNLAHYKTQASLRQPSYFKALTQQLKSGAGNDLDPVGLSAVLKYQQKSLNRKKDSFVPDFFAMVKDMEEPLLSRIPKLPSETLMHVLNLYYSLDLLSEDLFMAVIHRVTSQGLKEWRVKDIARVTHVITNIPHGEERRMEALAEILVELHKSERVAERRLFFTSMLQVAIAMTACAVYPHWLAQEIFSDSAQRKFKGSDIDWRRDLFHLSESILIEDGTYQGPLLWPENFPKLSKNKVYGRLSKIAAQGSAGRDPISQRDWALLDVMESLNDVSPDLRTLPVFMLPHFQTADIEIMPCTTRKESKGKPSRRKAYPSNMEPSDTAVVLHGTTAYHNMRCRDGKTVQLLRQYHSMRARQLRKLGVTVIEVPYADFMKAEDKCQYLQQKFADEGALEKLEL